MFHDWNSCYWPQLQNPWGLQPGVFNLPWVFVILQPLRGLGKYGGAITLQVVSVLTIIWVGKSLHISTVNMILVLLSPPVVWHVVMGQIDGLILLAYLAPPWLAAPLTLVKPQAVLGAGVRAWLNRPLRCSLVIAAIAGAAWVVWGWPFAITGTDNMGPLAPFTNPWNWSHWPLGLVMVPLLFLRDRRGGMIASPFVFPYAGVQSLVGPMLAMATFPRRVFVPVWVAVWVRWFYMLGFLS